jgi:hypothetical protein
MGDVLAVLFVLAIFVVAPALYLRWELLKRHRIHPKVASPAPLSWVVSPTAPARLHRRLQTTVRVASIHAPKKPLSDVALQAIELDRRVVLAARQPYGARGTALRQLVRECDELDRLALAVNRPFDAFAVGDPADRLTTLAEARAEVEAIDRTHRL